MVRKSRCVKVKSFTSRHGSSTRRKRWMTRSNWMSSVRFGRTGWITPTYISTEASRQSVDLAVPVGPAAGVHVELPAKAIHLPLQVPVFEFCGEPAPAALQVEVAKDQPTQMRGVRHAAGRREVRQRADDNDEIFRRNGKDERHEDWTLRVVHGERQQDPEQRTRGSDGDRVVGRTRDRERQQRDQNRRNRGADAGHGVIADEKLRPHNRSSSTPNIQTPSMLKRICAGPT